MANEARIRASLLEPLTLDAEYDPSTDTVISAPELADWPEVTSTAHMPITVNRDRAGAITPFYLYMTAHTLGATTATVDKDPHGDGTVEGTIPVTVPAGTIIVHGSTPRDYAQSKHGRRTSGTATINSTTWTYLDTGAAQVLPDLVLIAYVGDVVEYGLAGSITSSGAAELYVDATTVIGGSVANHFSAGGAGDVGNLGWMGVTSVLSKVGGGILRTLVSGDISAGTVTLRARFLTSASVNKVLNASSAAPFHFYAINHGPEYEEPVLPAS